MAYLKSVKLRLSQWESIKTEIFNQYPTSVKLSRRKMKEVLGFTPRFEYSDQAYVVLDFFSSESKFLFLLEFSGEIST